MKKTFIALLCACVSVTAANAQDKKPAQVPNKTMRAGQVPVIAEPPAPQTTQTVTPQAPNPNAGKFKFEEETHDFGEIVEGPFVECDFEFRNVGKSPIIISEAHGSCGCTVPKWPQEPILPKRKGIIHVTYNTAGRVGPINKDVIITSNASQNPMKLHLTGMVKPKPAEVVKPTTQPVPPAQPIK